ncbi:glycerophosphodiester phosphodiesterase [Microbulbifer sp. SH-1]|uniref:glycerophosphodiester phosphodiesterase n=1 Tax=Microbulbifer sp. SH-1 TaxID=2681547 RepID=UPI001409289F|nr:glycerophosphodiester phosphodiesterase [Microbulbifer sp. SH-1]QIL90024.1 glycerophosphodiester phosphodiesterase [Microbulbifer sp. SH-1]
MSNGSGASLWRTGQKRPMVIAHGDESGCGLFPGNTLLYLHRMVELGVDALEMDLNLTADGHLILMHDATLERTTNGCGAVIEHSLAQLRELNAAYNWSRDGEYFPYRDKPLRIATIDEVFEQIPDTPLIIELKNDSPAAAESLRRAIEKADCGERIIVSSYHRAVIREFRRLCPQIYTGVTMPEALRFYVAQWLGVSDRLRCGYRAMQLPMHYFGLNVYSRRFVRAARKHGLHLSVWTVDEREQMQHYIALGLDGIVTNRPDRLLELLEE